MTKNHLKEPFTLGTATKLLFHIAARSHCLAEQFGIELQDDDTLKFLDVPRPWLQPRYPGATELSFDPDLYAKTRHQCSTYTAHMRLWILNVWNPSYARSKKWKFDLMEAAGGLDSGNLNAIAWWLKHPLWP